MLRPLHLPLLGIFLLLSGCLYDNPPSGPAKGIDTWLVGQWSTADKAGHQYAVTVATPSSDRYHLVLTGQGKAPLEFDGWISRVDDFPILTLKSLNDGPSFGKYSLYHYELLSPATAPPGGIGATRIRLSELQLDDSCLTLDSFRLRAAIRSALKEGTLLVPHDVVAERKHLTEKIPGSVIWTRTGGVTLKGETF